MTMPGRNYSSNLYRYGFNGKENDTEVSNETKYVNFGGRIYDLKSCKWLSVDPLMKMYPEESPYTFAINSPLYFIDPTGNSVEPAEEKGKGLVSNAVLGILIHAAAKQYFDKQSGWRGEVSFAAPPLSSGRADLIYQDANGRAAIWEIKPVSYHTDKSKHNQAKKQLEKYKILAQSQSNTQNSRTKYSIGSTDGTPTPLSSTVSLTVEDTKFIYDVSFSIPKGEEKEGLIYYTINKKTPKPVVFEPSPSPVQKPIGGYPGQGFGEIFSKAIETATGKKITIPDPVPTPTPIPKPVVVF